MGVFSVAGVSFPTSRISEMYKKNLRETVQRFLQGVGKSRQETMPKSVKTKPGG